MKTKNFTHRLYSILLSFFLIWATVVSSVGVFAFADENGGLPAFYYSEEDLSGMAEYDDVALVRFEENGFATEQFELTFYVYNPQKTEFNAVDARNQIQFAFTTKDTDVLKTDYAKYRVYFVDQSETGLFMRFRIGGFSAPTSSIRYYCVSGLELVEYGAQNATEYAVGAIYKCTTSGNETTVSKDTLPTCEVDVTHTFYRSTFSQKGNKWANQVSSCYFSLPRNFSAKGDYGVLEALTAEFYNYFTKPIYVVNDEQTAEDLKNYVGVSIKGNAEYPIRIYVDHIGLTGGIMSYPVYSWAYSNQVNIDVIKANNYVDTLWWVLYDNSGQDFASDKYYFGADNLRNYFVDYSTKYGRDKAIEDLFESETFYNEQQISLQKFPYGYNKHTYSIAENPETGDDVLGFGLKFDNANWFQSFFGISSSETKDLLPLVCIDANDVNLSDKDFADKYFIFLGDVPSVKEKLLAETALGKDVWLFRYDCCEYYASTASVSGNGSAFVAQETVYLDFDILSFRFNQNGEKYIIGVNHSPEDIFNPLTPAPKPVRQALWQLLLAWGILVLSCIIAIVIMRFACKLLYAIINSNLNVVLKIIFSLLIIGAIVVLFLYAYSPIVDAINSLGGL